MSRVRGGNREAQRHKKILKLAKGYYGRKKNTFRAGVQAVEKGLQYAYRDRRNKKREFRALWIQRINAAVREHGLTYSQFTHGAKLAEIQLDRKILAAIAYDNPAEFAIIVKQAQAALDKAEKAA